MTVLELRAICDDAIARGFGELPIAATINPDASTQIQDIAYGDVYLAYPFTDGKVFAITAIKNGFPEALEAFGLNNPNSDWDVCLPDGEIILCDKTRAECESFVVAKGHYIIDTCEKFKFFTVSDKTVLKTKFILRKNGMIDLPEKDVDCILKSFERNGKEIINLVTILNEPYVFWDIDRVAHHRPNIKVDVMEVTYLANISRA